MSKLARTTAVSALALVVAFSGASAQGATFRLGHVFDATHPFHVAALEATEQFEACTDGEHRFEVYPASQLGSDAQMQEQLLIGGLDAQLAGFIFAANSYPPLAVSAAPFVFRDRDHAMRYMDSELFREAWTGWEEATGQHILSSAFFGFFHVTSNRPLETPEDMAGLRVRVPNMPIYMAFPEAVGAAPTPIALHEVYLALQQGVAEGSVNGLSMTYANRFYEVQEYVNLTGHMVDYTLFIVSDMALQQLDEAGQQCLDEAAALWGQRGSQLLYGLEEGLREELEGSGELTFVEVDREAFAEIAVEAQAAFAEMQGASPEALQAILDL
ncbi:TRAP transporter substrate-binding protein DctP [Pelagibacterium flavum]|uniref:TRAP transporter substrate-binding protein DctP n=1 Tax=Pelagibacterium flavum TaxID=2984530 RepID=A0ABY6IK11_9HYPH|nr:TRAP transporter substrate-binding protein DctP [Pelagibacterium sp. YIM 151497]UYQ70903.1 TRAP transporter substrate-binding protein DctP [Pelagibacterium sp. YIM 151497]